jgi:hypothetical protein
MTPVLPASSTYLASIESGGSAIGSSPWIAAATLCATTRAIVSDMYPDFGAPVGTDVLVDGSTATATPAA